MPITRPTISEYAPYFQTYIQLVNEDDLVLALKRIAKIWNDLIGEIPEQKLNYRYADGKWSIKEVLIHLTDAERVFAYRALRFARNDKTELSGFDENFWAKESHADERSLESLIKEHNNVRGASISLFENLTDEISMRSGPANGKEISVRALGYIICGHELHHLRVIQERYL